MLDRGEKLAVGLTLAVAVGGVLAMAAMRPEPAPVAPSSTRGGGADLPKIATISQGEPVDLDRHLAPEGRTIVEFTAGW